MATLGQKWCHATHIFADLQAADKCARRETAAFLLSCASNFSVASAVARMVPTRFPSPLGFLVVLYDHVIARPCSSALANLDCLLLAS